MKNANRKSNRKRQHDYSGPGAYFITINCKFRQHFFGEISNGKMLPSEIGQLVQEEWPALCSSWKQVLADEWVVMPDHFHALVWFLDDGKKKLHVEAPSRFLTNTQIVFESPSNNLGSLVRRFKGNITRKARELGYSKFRMAKKLPRRNHQEPLPIKAGASLHQKESE